MVAVRDARERRHRLALASGAEDEHSLGRELRGLVGVDERVLRERDVAEVARDVEVLAHRAADDDDLAPALDRDVGGLLHAVDVRGERRDEDLPVGAAGRSSGTPRRRAARIRCFRAARRSSSRRGGGRRRGSRSRRACPTSVLRPSTGVWSSFQSPVCTTRPAARLDHERGRVGNRVRDADELDRGTGRARAARRPGAASMSSAVCAEPVLVELRLHERRASARVAMTDSTSTSRRRYGSPPT